MKISAAALLAFSAVQAPFIVTKASAETIVEFIADETNGFTRFYESLVALDLISTLEGNETFTIFAIEDEYFNFDNENFQNLEGCLLNRTSVLQYHIAEGTLPIDMLTNEAKVPFLNGEEGSVRVSGSTVEVYTPSFFSSTTVITEKSDNVVSNGVVHVVVSTLPGEEDFQECNSSSANPYFSGTSFFGAVALMMTAVFLTL